jgi:putative membrane protein
MNYPEANKGLVKKLDKIAIGVSAFVLLVVVALRYLPAIAPDALPFDVHLLPRLHAVLNTLTAISLMTSIYFIKQKNVRLHQRMIYVAMGLSALFLVSYITYHLVTEPTSFGGEGFIKIVYFVLLITHILAAAIILPFILFTFIRGYAMDIPAHKRIAKWTFPIWMYVAVTGPICYLMLMPYYG